MGEITARPWGYFRTIEQTKDYHIKELCVAPGQRLSLQSHKYRDELWKVIEGEATVQLNNDYYTLKTGKTIQIYRNDKHRLSNNTLTPLRILEIQMGEYFGEDDIIRYEDAYDRC